jgi:hypothetical protein
MKLTQSSPKHYPEFEEFLQAPNSTKPREQSRLNSHFTRFNKKSQKYEFKDLPQNNRSKSRSSRVDHIFKVVKNIIDF